MRQYLKLGLALMLALSTTVMSMAQIETDEMKYRRSSIYSLLINHTDQKFADEIRTAFIAMPVPDKYNDHNLSVRVVNMNSKLKNAGKKGENQPVTEFLIRNKVASRLVARWFDRDKEDGLCNMNVVADRGLYNASEIDKELAAQTARGMAMLADAGEELIGNTFVLVNDIRYIDKAKRGQVLSGIFSIAAEIAFMSSNSSDSRATSAALEGLALASETYKGFKVKINTFLYQLVWNDEVAANFYSGWQGDWQEATREVFDVTRDNYTLRYVGKVESKGNTTSFLGIKEEEPQLMVRKACQRALDENVVDLQRQFEAFRTNSPLISAEPLEAFVGLKEGVSADSRFEVLETIEAEDGTRSYKRVGVIKPMKDKIWDNRFMAVEEGAENATLGKTTFQKVSGGPFYRGMLIREIDH